MTLRKTKLQNIKIKKTIQQYNTIQYNTIQYNTIQHNTKNTMQYNAEQNKITLKKTRENNTVQSITKQ